MERPALPASRSTTLRRPTRAQMEIPCDSSRVTGEFRSNAAENPHLREPAKLHLHSVEKGRFSTNDEQAGVAAPRKLPPGGN
jgi:hypothetical protein